MLFVLTLVVGWLPGVLYSPLLVIYVGFAIAYLAASIAVSVPAARNTGWDLLPILPVVFAVFHLSYGLGFATGMFDFWAPASTGIRKVDQASPRSPTAQPGRLANQLREISSVFLKRGN